MPTPELTPNLLHLKDKLASINRSNEGDQVEAVVAILLWDEPGRGLQTLLVQRAEREGDPWSGQIGLPGGRVKQDAETPRTALHREVDEEVGIKLKEVGVELGSLSVGHPMRRIEMRVQPWVYGLRIKPRVNIGPEIADSLWVNLAELPLKMKTSEITVRDKPWSVESFVVEGKIVWGFTYRVLTELLPILEISL
ncbi:NUDIX domain-containing protein [Candidatus Bathyarchaeota archaeon]|nr:MAG: NUDIX domain-containing protein [Candidatus Bathyarchaeota archaeon]TMI58693.1 MAG: NUDIX domain-containing protein [Candidatus Bathyarchaeota archaeon]